MLKKLFVNVEEYVGTVLLIIVGTVTTLQVVCRYLLSSPLSWTDEFCRFTFVWLMFMGASLALKKNEHFALLILTDKLPWPMRKTCRVISALLVVLFTVVLLVLGAGLTWKSRGVTTPALEIPRAIPYAAIPAGAFLMLIRGVECLIREIRQSPPKESEQTT